MVRTGLPAGARSSPSRRARGRRPRAWAWREGSRDLLAAASHIASICPHRHTDGKRGQVRAEPVTNDRVQQRAPGCLWLRLAACGAKRTNPWASPAAAPPRPHPAPRGRRPAPRRHGYNRTGRARRPDRGKGPPTMTWCTCSMRDTSPAKARPPSLPTARSSAGVIVYLPSVGRGRAAPPIAAQAGAGGKRR